MKVPSFFEPRKKPTLCVFRSMSDGPVEHLRAKTLIYAHHSFSTAFRRVVGSSPRQFCEQARRDGAALAAH